MHDASQAERAHKNDINEDRGPSLTHYASRQHEQHHWTTTTTKATTSMRHPPGPAGTHVPPPRSTAWLRWCTSSSSSSSSSSSYALAACSMHYCDRALHRRLWWSLLARPLLPLPRTLLLNRRLWYLCYSYPGGGWIGATTRFLHSPC